MRSLPQIVAVAALALGGGCVSAAPAPACPEGTPRGQLSGVEVLGFDLATSEDRAETRCGELEGDWEDGACRLTLPTMGPAARADVRVGVERDRPIEVRASPLLVVPMRRVFAELRQQLVDRLGSPDERLGQHDEVWALGPLPSPVEPPEADVDLCTDHVEVAAVKAGFRHGRDSVGFDLEWTSIRRSFTRPCTMDDHPVDDWPMEREEERLLPFDLVFEGALGVQDAASPLDHVVGSVTLGARHGLADAVEVETRARYLTGGDAGLDEDGDGADDEDETNLHALGATAEVAFTLWNEHGVDGGSDGWRLGFGGGYLVGLSDIAPSGPLVEASLSRVISHPELLRMALVGRYSRAFVSGEDYQAFTLGVEMATARREEDERSGWEPSFPYLFGGEITMAGFTVGEAGGFVPPGIAFHFGLPLGAWLDVRTRIDVLALLGAGEDGALTYAGAAGLRLRLTDWAPLWVETLAGYQLAYGTEPRVIDDGRFIDVGAGVSFVDLGGTGRAPGGPDLAAELGARVRTGLSQANEPLHAITFTFGVSYGSRAGALGGTADAPFVDCY